MPEFTVLGDVAPADFRAFSPRWEGQGRKVRCTGAEGEYHGYLVGDRVEGWALVVPNATFLAEAGAKNSADATEMARRALIAQRLQERADAHAAQKNATVTTFPQVQAHIRQIHTTLEALCRLQRGDVLNDIT